MPGRVGTCEVGETGDVTNLHFLDEVIRGHRVYYHSQCSLSLNCVSGNHLTDKHGVKWEVCKTQYHRICLHGSFRVNFCILLTLMFRLHWAFMQNESLLSPTGPSKSAQLCFLLIVGTEVTSKTNSALNFTSKGGIATLSFT